MKNKIPLITIIILNLLIVFYLISPTPKLPDLDNSVKSDLPGDTVQISNVSGYFTNMTRTEVINFYRSHYSGLFRINLNHPPEKAKQIIVDTIPSYYFEEFILPFKESLYINGFEWENDVFTKEENRIKNKLEYKGIEYKSKITIRTFPNTIPQRLISFFFTEFAILAAFFLIKSVFKKQ